MPSIFSTETVTTLALEGSTTATLDFKGNNIPEASREFSEPPFGNVETEGNAEAAVKSFRGRLTVFDSTVRAVCDVIVGDVTRLGDTGTREEDEFVRTLSINADMR